MTDQAFDSGRQGQSRADGRRRVTLDLPPEMVAQIDLLRREWGIRARGGVVEELLRHVFSGDRSLDAQDDAEIATDELDEPAGLVLVMGQALAADELIFELEEERVGPTTSGGTGIDLPGFVRRRSDQVRRSLHERPPTARAPLPRLQPEAMQAALAAVEEHWLSLYGTAANENVLEAAMIWLAKDIWPQTDPGEGRAFTWTEATRAMQEMVQGWNPGPADFARVIVTAGVLEDPFSGDTLALRIPPLIRRFVNRFRRRRRGASFHTLDNTMTLQGALKLLRIPVLAGQRLSLSQIRDAYRQQAMAHHPDAGGSVEDMRRINEAYQLLKELYRPKGHGSADA